MRVDHIGEAFRLCDCASCVAAAERRGELCECGHERKWHRYDFGRCLCDTPDERCPCEWFDDGDESEGDE